MQEEQWVSQASVSTNSDRWEEISGELGTRGPLRLPSPEEGEGEGDSVEGSQPTPRSTLSYTSRPEEQRAHTPVMGRGDGGDSCSSGSLAQRRCEACASKDRRIAELESDVALARAAACALEELAASKDRRIAELEQRLRGGAGGAATWQARRIGELEQLVAESSAAAAEERAALTHRLAALEMRLVDVEQLPRERADPPVALLPHVGRLPPHGLDGEVGAMLLSLGCCECSGPGRGLFSEMGGGKRPGRSSSDSPWHICASWRQPHVPQTVAWAPVHPQSGRPLLASGCALSWLRPHHVREAVRLVRLRPAEECRPVGKADVALGV